MMMARALGEGSYHAVTELNVAAPDTYHPVVIVIIIIITIE
jgi:hypothetical protein